MKDRDFLWCAINMILDEEEELAGLCPACRDRAEQERCAGCGAPLALFEGGVNESFDAARFERMKRGG